MSCPKDPLVPPEGVEPFTDETSSDRIAVPRLALERSDRSLPSLGASPNRNVTSCEQFGASRPVPGPDGWPERPLDSWQWSG